MLLHRYDDQTGQYISSFLPDEDPLERGRWVVPAFSTDMPLPARLSMTWPFFIEGEWILKPDHRGQMLYRKDNGHLGTLFLPGQTPDDDGLTPKPRPSQQHIWHKDDWALDPAAVNQQQIEKVMAQFGDLLDRARLKNRGKADAFAAGLLSKQDTYYFRRWSIYQMDLVKSIEVDGFPESVTFPNDPRDYAIAESEAISEINSRAARAKQQIVEKETAAIVRALSPEEKVDHARWIAYENAISHLIDDARFPDALIWPDEPHPSVQ